MVCKATPKNILHHYLDFAAHSQLLLRGCITSGGAGPAVVLVFSGAAVSQDEGRSAWIKACYGADEKDVCSSLLSHQNVHMQIESSSAPFSPLTLSSAPTASLLRDKQRLAFVPGVGIMWSSQGWLAFFAVWLPRGEV